MKIGSDNNDLPNLILSNFNYNIYIYIYIYIFFFIIIVYDLC